MSTVLVVGATGTTGREVVQKLSPIGNIKIRAATRHPHKVEKGISGQYVEFDYGDRSTIQKALEGVQKVFLVTPFVPELFPFEKAVIEEIKAAEIQHIVKLSVPGAEDKNGSQIGRIHGQLETLIAESGVPYTFLRPFSFMQNFINHAAYTIRSQNAFFQPAGGARINHVDTRDIGAVAAKILTEEGHEGKAYTLTGPEPLSNYEVAEILSSIAGKRIQYIDLPEDQARKAMRGAGMSEPTTEWLLELYRLYQTGLMDRITDDIVKVAGAEPTSFRQFAGDFKDCFQ